MKERSIIPALKRQERKCKGNAAMSARIRKARIELEKISIERKSR